MGLPFFFFFCEIGSCILNHVHREKNMVADCLAKKIVDQDIGICRLLSAPDFVISTMLDDIAGFSFCC